jgi:hypothetical protein
MPGLRDSPAYKALQAHYDSVGSKIQIKDEIAKSDRFSKYSEVFKTKDGDILVRHHARLVYTLSF